MLKDSRSQFTFDHYQNEQKYVCEEISGGFVRLL